MSTAWKGLTVVVILMLLCVLWVAARQSRDIADLVTTIEEDQLYVKGLEAELKRKDEQLGIKIQNEELERDRVDGIHTSQISNLAQSVDNLATGVREMRQWVAEHRIGHENLTTGVSVAAAATEALHETEAKVAAVEQAVRQLVVALEESRRADAGQATGNATVLSSEDRVLSTIEVGNIVDRLEKEISAVKEKLSSTQQLLEEVKQNQADEAEEDE